MLYLIGIGINGDITCNAKRKVKNAEEIYLESYTMPWDYEEVKIRLEEELGKGIELIERERVESDFLIKRAKEKEIALLIGGDVFAATTHITLYNEAKENGIEVEIFYNSSIFTAIGKVGLSLYKFGATTTISFWEENYKPTSPIKVIEKNYNNGMHSLVLLDIKERGMDAKEGIRLLKEMERIENLELIKDVVVVSRLGWRDEKISYGEWKELLKMELGKPPFCLIVPSKMNRIEEEFLERWRI